MAALQAERGYGLSCGRLGRGTRVSVFHVKLTDSAVRAFEGYQGSKVPRAGGGSSRGHWAWSQAWHRA
uniref:RNA polymerase II elongation factor ELL N-terminal domain-containing protein n=1 Tax=Gopherus evgoodei TaxID=1825980 RepID=A0A8C4YKQ3_9SAUR